MFKHPVFSLTKLGAACAAVAAIAAVQPVYAQTPATAPAATESSTNRSPEMTLQATASSEVKQDTVRISLSAEVEAPDQPAAGKKLTAALDDAVKRARDTKGVEVRTGGYNVWPNTNSKGKISSWRGQGEIVLESKDFEAAAALASKLSDKTAISNISFSLSREAREAEERKLLKEAAQAFKDRALAAANAFGFSGYRLSKLELGGSGGPMPMPRMMGAAAMAKDASGGYSPDVPLEAGDVTVSIAVNGTIVLQ
ncbi:MULTISPECIES: SIMPL domain-containing protein [Achromobacter]|jgi:predicted secreted protein|uniref:SIMPL domain-containing protein n=1 Tax=Achromobacter TaxID=222 RepID=UPI0006C5ABF5|nr:SIMPL domain-containing protein [Achromobacter kerstersii]CUJ62803.1 Predicted periplasmic/secreted protein [Achromobacter kerstersii]